MVRVLAVNNYPSNDRFDRLRKCFEGNRASVTVANREDCSPAHFERFDGVVLSGSPDMLSTESTREKFSRELDAISTAKVPLLGVCFGHQLIALSFGSRVVRDSRPVLRFVMTEVATPDPIFAGIGSSTMLLESRREVVESLPRDFRLLARSATSRIAAMKHRKFPIYGIQSHPERFSALHPDGNRILGNFIRALA